MKIILKFYKLFNILKPYENIKIKNAIKTIKSLELCLNK